MSGGRFDYQDEYAKCAIFGCSDKPVDVFKDREISEIVWDVFRLIHAYDWYASGDTSEGSWNKAVKDFKNKWFTDKGKDERYNKYIEDSARELRRVLGLEEKYCFMCDRFTENKSSEYGDCEHKKSCLVHKWDGACDLYKDKDSLTE